MNKNIALITFRQYEDFFEGVDTNEDDKLIAFLQQKNLHLKSVAWNNPDIDWKQFDLVILKSPWDYHDHIDAFLNWILMLQNEGIQVLNPAETILWNSNKKYLTEIADAQLPIIPSILIEKGDKPDWHTFFQNWDTNKIVVKPCISAGAKNTMLLSLDKIDENRAELENWIQSEDFLVQPYLQEVEQGEWSLLFFGETFSHAILKTPKDGDFRVQHSHGGSFSEAPLADTFIQKAGAYVEKFAKGSLYVRVDGIIKDDEFYLMELEMIEPYLYLDDADGAFDRYHDALLKLMRP
ncbi:ATP-grasp domain-containing protein [Pedobacter immunditicola]|uniref:ATP-grasp domain-containing protein n=1 Tax=Pedobacter immunditicola TaxID=3133440 RepID=UPI0030A33EA7